MTRTERLLALVAELRAAAPAPLRARALAERLEVSERTVQRDVAALARSGLPVRVERGQQGGYAIVSDPGGGEVVLSTTEAVAVAAALERHGDSALTAAGQSALRTIHRGLSDDRRANAGEPSERVRVLAETSSIAGPIRHTITQAVRTRRVVRVAYTDQSGERTRRDIEAHGLIVAPYGEYLVGWCRLRDAPRLFRVDRIAAAYLTTRDAGLRDLDELLAALRVPAQPIRANGGRRASPVRSRDWTLHRFWHVRLRLAEMIDEVRSAGEGAARVRAVLGHLAEWTRWQVAALRAVATASDMVFDGRRPDFPAEFDRPMSYPARERMIQDAMAVRSLGEVVRDLDEVLAAAVHWATDCDDALWREPIVEPGLRGRRRPLADLLAGWRSPLSHIEWHLDRLTEEPASEPEGEELDYVGERLVHRCPLRG